MDIKDLIKRTTRAADHAQWLGMFKTNSSLLALAKALKLEQASIDDQSFPASGDNFTNVIELSTDRSFTVH